MYRRVLVTALLVSALYTPLTATAAQVDAPPVADGDLGCVVATAFMAMASNKAATDPNKDAETRAAAEKIRMKSFEDNSFYLGRLSLLPAEQRTAAVYTAAYDRFSALDTDSKVKQIQACGQWAKDTKVGIVNPWTGK